MSTIMRIAVAMTVMWRTVGVRVGVAAAIALGMAGCNDLLKVTSPGSLREEQLADPALEQFVINGAIGDFQFAYANYVLWSGALADEVFTDHHVNTGFQEISLHEFNHLNPTNLIVYQTLHRARQSGEDAVGHIRSMVGASASSNLNIARALIYTGYSYVLLGEGFCETPVNLSVALSSRELLALAIARFDEAITVATAARSAAETDAAQDLISLARVGAARAALWSGEREKARAYAAPVRDDFGRFAFYSANSTRENNPVSALVRSPGTPWLGMHPTFQGLADVRVPQPVTSRQSLASHAIFPPLKPSMYSGWTVAAVTPIDAATHIRFASGLEARYIGIEADGPNAAMLSFVNARRAVASKPPVDLAESELLAEFRRQRSRDFFLTGQRLGDLRRYAAAGTDLFPTGQFPVRPVDYGTQHCFLVPANEKTGNPNY